MYILSKFALFLSFQYKTNQQSTELVINIIIFFIKSETLLEEPLVLAIVSIKSYNSLSILLSVKISSEIYKGKKEPQSYMKISIALLSCCLLLF